MKRKKKKVILLVTIFFTILFLIGLSVIVILFFGVPFSIVNVPSEGLISYWDFEEITDISKPGNYYSEPEILQLAPSLTDVVVAKDCTDVTNLCFVDDFIGALGAVSSGKNIFVKSGNYILDFPLSLPIGVGLIGENKETTILNGEELQENAVSLASNSQLKNIKIIAPFGVLAFITQPGTVTIEDNIIIGINDGIFVKAFATSDITIKNNYIETSYDTVMLEYSISNVILQNNKIKIRGASYPARIIGIIHAGNYSIKSNDFEIDRTTNSINSAELFNFGSATSTNIELAYNKGRITSSNPDSACIRVTSDYLFLTSYKSDFVCNTPNYDIYSVRDIYLDEATLPNPRITGGGSVIRPKITKDKKGNNHGEVFGTTITEGIEDNGLNFVEGDYIAINNPIGANPPELTIMAWVKTQTSGIILSDPQEPPKEISYHLTMSSCGSLIFGINEEDELKEFETNCTNAHDGNWHFIVATKNQSEARIYLDGNLINSWVSIGSIYYPFGETSIKIGEFFNGDIDEIALYGRALTSQEIKGHYNTILPSPAGGGGGGYRRRPTIQTENQTGNQTEQSITESEELSPYLLVSIIGAILILLILIISFIIYLSKRKKSRKKKR